MGIFEWKTKTGLRISFISPEYPHFLSFPNHNTFSTSTCFLLCLYLCKAVTIFAHVLSRNVFSFSSFLWKGFFKVIHLNNKKLNHKKSLQNLKSAPNNTIYSKFEWILNMYKSHFFIIFWYINRFPDYFSRGLSNFLNFQIFQVQLQITQNQQFS